MGLADQLGNLDYVAREVVKAEDLVDYSRTDTWQSVLPSALVQPSVKAASRHCEDCRRCAKCRSGAFVP